MHSSIEFFCGKYVGVWSLINQVTCNKNFKKSSFFTDEEVRGVGDN